MSTNKKQTCTLSPVSFNALVKKTGNIYDTVNIVSKRTRTINTRMQESLDKLLKEFGSPKSLNDQSYLNDCLEICKSFDSVPKAHITATNDMLQDDLIWEEQSPKDDQLVRPT